MLLPTTALAQVPNESAIAHAVGQQFNVGTPHGLDAYVDAVACALNAKDPRFGHLRKTGGTQTHGHAHDGVLFNDNGTASFIDLVVAAGAPTASISWSVHAPIYTATNWLPPHNCAGTVPPVVTPAPAPTPVPVDLTAITAALVRIENALAMLQDTARTTQSSVSEVGAQLGGVAGRIESVLTSNDRIIRQLLSPPEYSGRFVGLLRPTVRPVTP